MADRKYQWKLSTALGSVKLRALVWSPAEIQEPVRLPGCEVMELVVWPVAR